MSSSVPLNRGTPRVYHGAVHPETKFAQCEGIAIAYQTFGDGPDLVTCPAWVTNVEYGWEVPERARFHEELQRFARVTLYDKRGTGLSGALVSPIKAIVPGMDVEIIVEAFIVVVIGGLGSFWGTFLGAMIYGQVLSFGILIFPRFSIFSVFALMAVILIVRPWGLLGKPLK